MANQMDQPILTPPINEHDHVWGPVDAAVTVVEYGDYECPHCGRAHPIVKELQRVLGDKIRFVFRNFPLAQVHPHAEHAAEAAEAAGAQGKFWAMHDMLFENQFALEEENLVAYGAIAGVSEPRFIHDLQEHKYLPKVREDFMSGVRSGVNGTPTFFINGLRHNGPWDLDGLLTAIKSAADTVSTRKAAASRKAPSLS